MPCSGKPIDPLKLWCYYRLIPQDCKETFKEKWNEMVIKITFGFQKHIVYNMKTLSDIFWLILYTIYGINNKNIIKYSIKNNGVRTVQD